MTFTWMTTAAVLSTAVTATTCSPTVVLNYPSTRITPNSGTVVATTSDSVPAFCCQACEQEPECWAWSWQMTDKLVWRAEDDYDVVQFQTECKLYGLGTQQEASTTTTGTVDDALALVDPAAGVQEHLIKTREAYSYRHPDCSANNDLLFHCGASVCVAYGNVCDGHVHCPGGQDEDERCDARDNTRFQGAASSGSRKVANRGECEQLCTDSSMCQGWTHWQQSNWCALFLSQEPGISQAGAKKGTTSKMSGTSCHVTAWSQRYDLKDSANTYIAKLKVQDEHECCDQCEADTTCVGFHYNFWRKKCVLMSATDGATASSPIAKVMIVNMRRQR